MEAKCIYCGSSPTIQILYGSKVVCLNCFVVKHEIDAKIVLSALSKKLGGK